uniref:Beta-lactamase-related domain-containing protein n=1 Tax=Branchiostoma floridae TaxID=7739 RepID=C3XWV9_BRAFL|eukprot:XP_002611209.1 hypothetical protein BRAFLDRAFT_71169 [Branchiostoma floridae]
MAKTFVVLLSTLVAVLSQSEVAATATTSLEEELHDLDNFVQTVLACRSDSVPGLTIAVVRNRDVVFAKGYGRRDSNRGLPVNNRTLFGIASLTKSFTAALLADILAERDDVTWDTPLVDILGEEFRFQDEFRTKEATLRDLLAHKMGLQKFPDSILQFGSNVGRAELARLLKLNNPAGGVASNAVDMARYLQYHLRAARGHDNDTNKLLQEAYKVQFVSSPRSEERLKEIFRPQFPVGVMEKGAGYKKVTHGGRVFGFTSLMTLFPDQTGGVFTSVNSPVINWDRDVHRVLHYRVADMLLDLDPWLNTTTACTYPQPWSTRPASSQPVPPATSRDFPRDKRDYVGSYGNRVFGNLTIYLSPTDGTLRFRAGLIGRGVVLPLNATNRILLKGPPDMFAPVQVSLEEEGGTIRRLVVPGVPPEPPVVFERGLKVPDGDGTQQKVPDGDGTQQKGGCTSGAVSGAETAVHGAWGGYPLLTVFLLVFVFI